MAFRFQAKSVFLTYPNCVETKEGLLEFLKDKLASRQPIYIVVSEELHANDTTHFHALCVLTRKLDTANNRYFDAGDAPFLSHPNIQAPRNLRDVYEYVTKGTSSL